MSEYELYHYGRKGMKWGQNIFGKVKGVRKDLATMKVARAAMDFAAKKDVHDRAKRDYEFLKNNPDEDKELAELYRKEELPALREHLYKSYRNLQKVGKQYCDRYGDFSFSMLGNDARAVSAGMNKYRQIELGMEKLEFRILDEIDDRLYD